MSLDKPVRKPFFEPVVSDPIDALATTRAFGGMLGQVILGGGSSGTALDDGDYCNGASMPDSTGQDVTDGPMYTCP